MSQSTTIPFRELQIGDTVREKSAKVLSCNYGYGPSQYLEKDKTYVIVSVDRHSVGLVVMGRHRNFFKERFELVDSYTDDPESWI